MTDPRVGFFSFVGSARVGWSLRAKLAPGTRCALEHGGAAPVIVAPDADLDRALPALVEGRLLSRGAGVRVGAARLRAREHRRRSSDGASRSWPRSSRSAIRPVPGRKSARSIRAGEVERIASWVEEAAGRGAHVLTGGTRLPGNCYAPTVLYDPPDDCRVSREEVFGPVVCVYPYRDIADAVRRANALPWSFQAAVFTRDLDAGSVRLPQPGRLGRDGERPHGVPRRLDAVRRAARVGARRRRHPVHLPRHAGREDVRDPERASDTHPGRTPRPAGTPRRAAAGGRSPWPGGRSARGSR